jgi:hypothetical protein
MSMKRIEPLRPPSNKVTEAQSPDWVERIISRDDPE